MHAPWVPVPRALAAPVVAVVAAGLQLAAIGTLSPQLVTDLAGGDLYVYIVLSYLVASIVGAGAAVALAPRVPLRRIVAIAMVVLAAGLVISGLAPQMALVVVGRAVSGLGAGLAFAVAPAFVSGVRPDRRAIVGGAVAAAFAITFAVSPAVGGFVTDLLGWRAALLLGVPIAAVAFVLARGRDDHPALAARAPSAPGLRVTSTAAVAGAVCTGAAAFVALVFVPLASAATGIVGVGAGAVDAAVFVVGVLLAGLAWAWPPSRRIVRLRFWSAAILFFGLAALTTSEMSGGPVPTVLALILAGFGVALSLAAFADGSEARGLQPDGRMSVAVTGAGDVDPAGDGNVTQRGAPRDVRAGLVSVMVRQIGGLAGLGVAGALFIVTLRDRLVGDLRTLLEFALLSVPKESRAEIRAAAEAGIASIGSGFDPSYVANLGRSFAEQMLVYIPEQYRPLVQPYLQALNTVFTDAARHALAATFGAGAALALIAVVIVGMTAIVTRSRQTPAG